jgi:hypothetical protein
MIKSFLLLFFKKEVLLALTCKWRRGTAPAPTCPRAAVGGPGQLRKKKQKTFDYSGCGLPG